MVTELLLALARDATVTTALYGVKEKWHVRIVTPSVATSAASIRSPGGVGSVHSSDVRPRGDERFGRKPNTDPHRHAG
jgi:hypothetical protein